MNAILPELFEKTNDYTEILLNVSFTDKDGLVYHLVNNIPEKDFKIKTEEDEEKLQRGEISEEDMPAGQVEIMGWLYQYYNTEPKDETFALLKKNVKITKERIPAATQLFTPDWIVRYMVENSLGRLWIERERANHPELSEESLSSRFVWKYYLPEAEQEADVQKQLDKIREEYKALKPEDIKVIDPCMGSGHILVYAFEVLMQIYESYGYSQRDAAKSIITYNLYGLDIDNRAYQLAYFAVMMKARQYNRRILNGGITCHLYAIHESNEINRAQLKYFGYGMSALERNNAINQMEYLMDTLQDAKEYGSIINVKDLDWALLYRFVGNVLFDEQMAFDTTGLENTQILLRQLVEIATVLAQKYDVVATNPPYMGSRKGMNAQLKRFVDNSYPEAKSDLYACFIEKCLSLTKSHLFTAMITQQSFMFTDDYKELRSSIISLHSISTMLHLGVDAFPDINGEVVQTTTFVLKRGMAWPNYFGKFIRLVDLLCDEKPLHVHDSVNSFICSPEKFNSITASPISYWLSESMRNSFINGETFEKYGRPRQGLATGENDSFLRNWYEVNLNKIGFNHPSVESFHASGCMYIPYNKGGKQIRWYGNNDFVIKFDVNNYQILSNQGNHLPSRQYYCLECITWSDISGRSFAARYCNKGFVFDVKGSCGFPSEQNLWFALALLNCKLTPRYIDSLNPTTTTQVGDLKRIPVISPSQGTKEKIDIMARSCVQVSKNDWDSYETSWDFKRHPFIKYKISASMVSAYKNWELNKHKEFINIKSNEEMLNRIFINIYGLQDELTPEIEDNDVTIHIAVFGQDIRSFISYSVGCMFGRYSLDEEGLIYAGGEWDDSKYKTLIPDKDNILPITDEEYFEDDIVGLFCSFVKKTFGEETLEENLDFIAKALGNKGNSSCEKIRNYFINDFFKDHCKVYQKRPIYWLFDSGKADGFKALVYMHRYNEDTIGNLRIDYLHRMQRVYENEIIRMQETIENSNDAREVTAASKRKDKLVKQLKETKEYDEKIAHLALARIAIDLDDGVNVNYEKVQTGTDGKKLEVLAKI